MLIEYWYYELKAIYLHYKVINGIKVNLVEKKLTSKWLATQQRKNNQLFSTGLHKINNQLLKR